MYRDEHNYKKYAEAVVSGIIDAKQLCPLLKDGEFFIPSYVGLESLSEYPPRDYDHVWHTIESVTATNDPATINANADSIIMAFEKAYKNNWDEKKAFKDMGFL